MLTKAPWFEAFGSLCRPTVADCAQWPIAQMYGLNSECDGKVWRVDVGMSSGVLNAEAQVWLSISTSSVFRFQR